MIEAIQRRLAREPRAPGPKYQTLHDAILAAISEGEWKAGARLPTETELARSLPFSLGTVQKAYGELVRSGLVVRARGRGSFVAPPHRQMAEPWHCRFLGADGTVLPVYPRLLRHEVVATTRRWRALFGAGAVIVRIDRALSIAGEFEVLSRFFALEAVAKPLLALPQREIETANFKTVLLRELGMPISRIVQTIATADQETWNRLGLASPPHLVLEAIAYTAEGDVAYVQDIYIPPNRCKLLFDSELAR